MLPALSVLPSDVVALFLSGKSKNTLEAYRRDIESFVNYLNANGLITGPIFKLHKVEAFKILQMYKNSLVDNDYSSNTVNRKLAAIRSLFSLAKKVGLIDWSIDVANLKSVVYADTRGPGVVALKRMFAQVKLRDDFKSARDYAILRLLTDLGLRASELVNLDLQDVDCEAGKVMVIGKGKRNKVPLSLSRPTLDAVSAWISMRGSDIGPLFYNLSSASVRKRLTRVGLYKLVRKLGAECGVKVRPHGIRHTVITEACKIAQKNGYGIEEVLSFSRHSSVKTLMIYRDQEKDRQGEISDLVADLLKVG